MSGRARRSRVHCLIKPTAAPGGLQVNSKLGRRGRGRRVARSTTWHLRAGSDGVLDGGQEVATVRALPTNTLTCTSLVAVQLVGDATIATGSVTRGQTKGKEVGRRWRLEFGRPGAIISKSWKMRICSRSRRWAVAAANPMNGEPSEGGWSLCCPTRRCIGRRRAATHDRWSTCGRDAAG
jgi:hypothetical protein